MRGQSSLVGAHSLFYFYTFANLHCDSVTTLGEASVARSKVGIVARGASYTLGIPFGTCSHAVLRGCRSRGCPNGLTLPIVSGRGVGRCLGSVYRLYNFAAPMGCDCCGSGTECSRIRPG